MSNISTKSKLQAYEPKAVENYYEAVRAFHERIIKCKSRYFRDLYIAAQYSSKKLKALNDEYSRLFGTK